MYIEDKNKIFNLESEDYNMTTIKDRNTLREITYHDLSMDFQVEGCDFEGRTSEGLLFYNSELDAHIVIKVIIKKEGYEAQIDLDEYEARVERARKREEERKQNRKKKDEPEESNSTDDTSAEKN